VGRVVSAFQVIGGLGADGGGAVSAAPEPPAPAGQDCEAEDQCRPSDDLSQHGTHGTGGGPVSGLAGGWASRVQSRTEDVADDLRRADSAQSKPEFDEDEAKAAAASLGDLCNPTCNPTSRQGPALAVTSSCVGDGGPY